MALYLGVVELHDEMTVVFLGDCAMHLVGRVHILGI